MNTVNVIEMSDMSKCNPTIHLKAFPDTEEGNKAAEELFCRLIEENFGFDYLEDGYFSEDDYYVAIVHST